MVSTNNNKSFSISKGRTAFFYLLASLMLVISCPFKRMLLPEGNMPSSARQSVNWNGVERNAASYLSACNCTPKQKINLDKIEISKKLLPGTDFITDLNRQTGFSIHHFLNGNGKPHNALTATTLSSLPLFLKHRRLLI